MNACGGRAGVVVAVNHQHQQQANSSSFQNRRPQYNYSSGVVGEENDEDDREEEETGLEKAVREARAGVKQIEVMYHANVGKNEKAAKEYKLLLDVSKAELANLIKTGGDPDALMKVIEDQLGVDNHQSVRYSTKNIAAQKPEIMRRRPVGNGLTKP